MKTASLAQDLSHKKHPVTFHERSVSNVQARFMFSQVPHKTFEIIMDTLNHLEIWLQLFNIFPCELCVTCNKIWSFF